MRSTLGWSSPSIAGDHGPHDGSADLGMLGAPGAFQDEHDEKDTAQAQEHHTPGQRMLEGACWLLVQFFRSTYHRKRA